MIHLSELTVGQVAAIIAAGVAVIKLCLPNLLAFLFIGMLREDNGTVTASAVSWSAISKLLHSSNWPTLLRGDSTASEGVVLSARIFKYAGLLATLLVSIAAIVTPLGLYEAVVPSESLTDENFHYIVDSGIFGQGTPPRNESLPWSRVCDSGRLSTCPSLTRNSSATNNSIDTIVPQETVELFSSGVSALSDSVSSIFDIQWRSWTWVRLVKNDSALASPDDTVYPVGTFRPMATVVLDDKLEAVEGLVVDAVSGGIGFRNHSAPPFTPYGSTWTEDLLFIQPVTQCVDTNLTIEYTLPLNTMYSNHQQMTDLRLVDKGGFSMLNLTFPQWNQSGTQTKPDLWMRAYQAAWLNNVYAMKLLNVSDVQQSNDLNSPLLFQNLNSTLGKEFPLSQLVCSGSSDLRFFSANMFGCFAPANYNRSFNLTPEVSSDYISEDISLLCEGDFLNDLGNIVNIAAYCSLIFGLSQRTDGSDDMSPLPGSKWSTPMYSCMSGVEALIKTVTFAFNTTDDVNGLAILNISDKTYPNETAKPLWGVENLAVTPDIMSPLWGLVSPEAVAKIRTANLQTLRKESLFLPGSAGGGFVVTKESQNLPGVDFFVRALAAAYTVGTAPDEDIVDYSGRTNLALSRRWSDLSKSAGSMTRVLNLIWTDYAANAVVGTKGLASTQQGCSTVLKRDIPETGVGVTIPVTVYNRHIKYHFLYAVPAVMVLVFLLLTLIFTSAALLFGQTSPMKMKRYLNATSAGRIMASTLESPSGKVDNDDSSKAWIENRGRTRFSAGRGKPVPAGGDRDRGHGGLLRASDDENRDTGHAGHEVKGAHVESPLASG